MSLCWGHTYNIPIYDSKELIEIMGREFNSIENMFDTTNMDYIGLAGHIENNEMEEFYVILKDLDNKTYVLSLSSSYAMDYSSFDEFATIEKLAERVFN